MIFIVIFSILYNLVKFFELTTEIKVGTSRIFSIKKIMIWTFKMNFPVYKSFWENSQIGFYRKSQWTLSGEICQFQTKRRVTPRLSRYRQSRKGFGGFSGFDRFVQMNRKIWRDYWNWQCTTVQPWKNCNKWRRKKKIKKRLISPPFVIWHFQTLKVTSYQ